MTAERPHGQMAGDMPARWQSPPILRYAGRVGVPGPGEKVCPRCKGHGQRRNEVGPFNGCGRCDATGVIPA